MAPLTYERMLERYDHAKRLAEKIRRKRMMRANDIARRAGLSRGYDLCVHNALVDLSYGKPWKHVDYHLLRLARHVNEQAAEPSRVVSQLYSRLYDQWRDGGCAYERTAAQ